MTRTDVISLPLPDAEARRRIAEDLDTNLLVEAGAGSGKTTELVTRMVALVETGTATVEEIAAVTFTRKAAGELRERFQTGLEERIRELEKENDGGAAGHPVVNGAAGEPSSVSATVAPSADRTRRLRRALDDIELAFVGTIHSFCARLLREHPLEAGLDPSFEELPVEERQTLRRRFWDAYLERLTRDVAPVLEELSGAGLRPTQLFGLFDRVVENSDVTFPTQEAEAPSTAEIAAVRNELSALVDQAMELMPEREPPRNWDALQRKMRTLHFTRDVTGWRNPADFFDALGKVCKPGPNGHAVTQNRWRNGDLAKAFRDQVNAFGVGEERPANRLLDRWYAHRYALAVRLARNAAADFAEERLRTGRLDFQDLLLLTARLLRADRHVRRELGTRYRRILVDEFQDTDPLQAEVVMLLASEPGDAEGRETRAPAGGASDPDEARDGGGDNPSFVGEGETTDGDNASSGGEGPSAGWRGAVPRPGALFVVGDPKQSIYRFRRADIQLYDFVKERFADFGGLVRLTSNFRSRPRIGDLVNEVFDRPDFFPAESTPEQARFEPLVTRPKGTPAPAEGVFWYTVAPDGRARSAVTRDDAARVSSWIRSRIDAGERPPGAFMILTPDTHYLSAYARALEERSVPVQVTGAGVGVEEELQELVALLECMIDPTNPVKVVAVLVGLFFGLDYEALVAHRLDGGSLDAMRPGSRGHPEVRDALSTLHGWWLRASRDPADVFVGQVVSELGLLPYAAAGELGSIRAGALIFALDAVRAAALRGDASLPGALAALRSALDLREAEAPLEPGRADVVRVMNLHQAKGLEADVVVLADPSGGRSHAIDVHTERLEDGTPVCWVRVTEKRDASYRGDAVLARPMGWQEKEEAERGFDAAERVRLLYVAVTRARDELVVATRTDPSDSPAWGVLQPWLVQNGTELPLAPVPPAPREEVHTSPQEVAAGVREAERRLVEAGTATYRHVTVTEVAKGESKSGHARAGEVEPPGGTVAASVQGPPPSASETFRGYSWGSAVHGALASAAGGATERRLRATCRALLVENERPLDDRGMPVELEELLALVRAVRASPLWARASASERVLVEVPFAAAGVMREAEVPEEVAPDPPEEEPSRTPRRGKDAHRQLDLFGPESAVEEVGTSADRAPGTRAVLEGVIDLAFREAEGWVIADYKTDVGTDPDFPARVEAYRRQVDLYAQAWTHLTGEHVKERVLFFTAQNRVEAW